MNFPQIFAILTGIPGNSFKVLQNSGIPQDFELAGFGILHKLLLSFLEILKFLGTQFNVVHRYPGSEIFYLNGARKKGGETSGDPCMKCSSHVTIQVSTGVYSTSPSTRS